MFLCLIVFPLKYDIV